MHNENLSVLSINQLERRLSKIIETMERDRQKLNGMADTCLRQTPTGYSVDINPELIKLNDMVNNYAAQVIIIKRELNQRKQSVI